MTIVTTIIIAYTILSQVVNRNEEKETLVCSIWHVGISSKATLAIWIMYSVRTIMLCGLLWNKGLGSQSVASFFGRFKWLDVKTRVECRAYCYWVGVLFTCSSVTEWRIQQSKEYHSYMHVIWEWGYTIFAPSVKSQSVSFIRWQFYRMLSSLLCALPDKMKSLLKLPKLNASGFLWQLKSICFHCLSFYVPKDIVHEWLWCMPCNFTPSIALQVSY